MANEELARTYAQAIFDKGVERWRRDLHAVSDAVEKENVVAQLDSPSADFEQKREMLNRFIPPNADGEVRNFMYLLASKNQMHLLPEVLSEFERFVARGPMTQSAKVSSAIELSDQERKRLEDKVRAQFGADVDFDYRVDQSLLGGVVVRVGDKVIDGSVAGKLAAMRQKLETTR